MKTWKKIKKQACEFFYDHPRLRITLEYLLAGFGACLSAFVFAFSFKAFVDPIVNGNEIGAIVTGGAGGLAQIVVKIFQLIGFPVNELSPFGDYWNYVIQSAAYVIINIPVFILAYRKIGKKFGFFTIINVVTYFIIVNLLPSEVTNMFYSSNSTNVTGLENDTFVRALFAGICTGMSTVIAFKFDHSAGGTDVVSVYLNGKKNNISIGKITLLINVGIVIIYTILEIANNDGDLSSVSKTLYSFVYFFTSSTVVDTFNSRDKKNQLQIITTNEQMADIFITYFPHSCTIINGKGAYTKQDKYVIYTVISIFEVKKAIKVIQEIDPNAFISVTKVNQVAGRFFIKPRK